MIVSEMVSKNTLRAPRSRGNNTVRHPGSRVVIGFVIGSEKLFLLLKSSRSQDREFDGDPMNLKGPK